MAFPLAIAALRPLLLGRDRHQQVRASQTLLATAMFVAFALIQHAEVMLGLIDRAQSHDLTVFNLGCNLLFYALIRSGLNLRLAPREPSMTLPQMVCAVTGLCWSYAITGPARGALLALLIPLLMMGGLFQLRAAQTRGLALYAFGLLAAVMVWRSSGFTEQRYDPRVEVIHFAFATVVLLSAAELSVRMGRLRARLSAQKAELGQALERNRLLATRDALTGLLNRRSMAERLHQGSSGEASTVALIDLDWFKQVNDRHGHGVGDEVLCRFAEVAQRTLRESDTLARWGGEEFLLVLPDTPPEEAEKALNRLRDALAAVDFEPVAPGLRITFSAGLASLPAGECGTSAIEQADRALYEAKRLGRNRIEHATPALHRPAPQAVDHALA